MAILIDDITTETGMYVCLSAYRLSWCAVRLGIKVCMSPDGLWIVELGQHGHAHLVSLRTSASLGPANLSSPGSRHPRPIKTHVGPRWHYKVTLRQSLLARNFRAVSYRSGLKIWWTFKVCLGWATHLALHWGRLFQVAPTDQQANYSLYTSGGEENLGLESLQVNLARPPRAWLENEGKDILSPCECVSVTWRQPEPVSWQLLEHFLERFTGTQLCPFVYDWFCTAMTKQLWQRSLAHKAQILSGSWQKKLADPCCRCSLRGVRNPWKATPLYPSAISSLFPVSPTQLGIVSTPNPHFVDQ